MPSPRRTRLYALLLVVTLAVLLYMTTGARRTRESDFYTKTQQALLERDYLQAAKQRDADGVGSRLKAAEQQAKKMADGKDKAIHGDASNNDLTGRGNADADKILGVAAQGGRAREQAVARENETPEDHEVEMELNAILKKSPIIIFSKTYCPHSRDAKRILLEKYKIVPAPYVVELDVNPLGTQLQALLARSTGRRTVPNVLLMGKSIGGGDDILNYDETDQLASKIKEMGGTRITEIERRSIRPEVRRRRALS